MALEGMTIVIGVIAVVVGITAATAVAITTSSMDSNDLLKCVNTGFNNT